MRLLTMASALFCVFSLPVFAEDLTNDTFLGRDIDEVRISLEAMGYKVVRDVANDQKVSDAPIHVTVMKDGKSKEIDVDANSGMPTRIEMK